MYDVKKFNKWNDILVIFVLIMSLSVTFGLASFIKFDYNMLNFLEIFFLFFLTAITNLFIGDYTIRILFKNEQEDLLFSILYFSVGMLFCFITSITIALIINPIFILSGIITFLFFVVCLFLISNHQEKELEFQN